MNFEKLYSYLPECIKYNNFILNLSLELSKKLRKINNKSNIVNSQQQLLELIFLNSDIKIKGTLKDIQDLYLELLKFIDNVCNKYNLNYWITGGTLLGAVRHGGFIPWDDDIDINMIREDYEKFIEVIPNEIRQYNYFKEECGLSLLRDKHKNYFKDFKSVYDFEGNKEFLHPTKYMFLQIAWLKPYIKIDIFPRDYIYKDKINYFNKNYMSIKYKFNQDIKNGKKTFNEEIIIKNKKLGFTKEKTEYMNDGLDSLIVYPIKIHETKKVFPLEKIKFEHYEFKCPKNRDYYLKILLGPNYMHIPQIIENHNIIQFIESQFSSKEEMGEKFKKDIRYLRDINKKYEN